MGVFEKNNMFFFVRLMTNINIRSHYRLARFGLMHPIRAGASGPLNS